MTGTERKFHQMISTDNGHLYASGDGAGRCCRLCGGDTGLKVLGDIHLREGVVERYDEMLFDCFRVRVSPSDCMICEWCIRQLRCTERFIALVYAAFDKPQSSTTFFKSPPQETKPKVDEAEAIDSKTIIELLKTKMADNKKTRRSYEGKIFNSDLIFRRINIECRVCKQKYRMLLPYVGGIGFVCSKCKKAKETKRFCITCNLAVAVGSDGTLRKHMKSHLKSDLSGKTRQLDSTKQPSQMKRKQDGCMRKENVPKHLCALCPKKYVTSEHLAEHIKCQHREKNTCIFCRKQVKSKEVLVQHMKMHRNHTNLNYFSAGPAKFVAKIKREVKMRGLAREK